MVNFLVITTVPVIETPKGVALNDGTKAVDISPATVRVPNKDGWIQIKDYGTLPSLNDNLKLIYLKKGNNSTGIASIFPMLTATETEELVAIAFANPNKIWTGQAWESNITFKGRSVKVKGYGINNNNVELDILSTGWVDNIN